MLLSGMELVDIHVPELRHSCQWHPGLDMFVFFSDSIAVLVFFLGTLAPSQAVLCSFYILQ